MKAIVLILVTALSLPAFAKYVDKGEIAASAYFFGPRGYITSARVVRDLGANNFVFRIVWKDDNGVEQTAAENDQWLLPLESVRNVVVEVDLFGILRFKVKSDAPDIVEWDYTIGVSYMGGKYVVTEFWRNSNSSPEFGILAESCTYNLRSGEGIYNGRVVEAVSNPIPVADFDLAYFTDCLGLQKKPKPIGRPK